MFPSSSARRSICILGPGQVDFTGIAALLVRIAWIVAVTALLQWLMNTINNKITYQVVRDVRDEAFRRIQILPLKYLDAHPHGEIVSRVIADVDQFADGLLMGFTQLFTGVVTILGTLCFMLSIHPGITLVVVAAHAALAVRGERSSRSRTYAMFKLQSETRGRSDSHRIDEMIGNQKTVQAFSRREGDRSINLTRSMTSSPNARCAPPSFPPSPTPATRFVNSVVYAGVGLAGALVGDRRRHHCRQSHLPAELCKPVHQAVQ